MVKMTSGRDDHVRWPVVSSRKLEQVILCEGVDRIGCPEDRGAYRISPPNRLRKQLVNQIFRCILYALDLFEDDSTFLGKLGGIERRVPQQIRKHGKRDVEMLG